MLTLWVRILQFILRATLKIGILEKPVWSFVLKARASFSQASPPLELETTFDNDIRIITSLSDHIESQLFWQGFQEADVGTITLLKHYLPINGVFIDIGANIGSFTLVAARQASQGQVHAFEPGVYHFSKLTRNIKLNNFNNVVLNRKGLYDQSCEATLFLPSQIGKMNNSGAASLYRKNETSQVSEVINLICLDDYVRDHNLSRIDIIKIDIEGAELRALKGAAETIMHLRPLVLMELDLDNLARANSSPIEVLKFWESLNYKVSIIHATGKTVPVKKAEEFGPHQNIECRAL